jgi:hypothetical protein
MSLIDARLPSFSTSVLESIFSGCPATVSVLLERSNRSTAPWSSVELDVELVPEAVAPGMSLELVPVAAEESVPVPMVAEESVPVLEDVVPVEPVDDGVLPIEPLCDSFVFAVEDDPLVPL